MLMHGRLERTETNPMHFKWEVTWTHGNQPNTFWLVTTSLVICMDESGSCHKRQIPQARTPQAPIRNRQTRKVANAKGLNRNTNLT